MALDADEGRMLEQRLRLIEDRFEIYNLTASHPPSADTGAGDYTASVWTEDGVFDRGPEFPRPTGRAAIAGGSANPEHHRAIEEGIAHFAGLPYVRVTGDTAFAISYLQILVPDRVGPLFASSLRARFCAARWSHKAATPDHDSADAQSVSTSVCLVGALASGVRLERKEEQ